MKKLKQMKLPKGVLKNEVQNILDENIFVLQVKSLGKSTAENSRYFYEEHGIPMYNDEDEYYKHYDYRIYYPSLCNSFLMHGDTIISYVTLDSHPELFL